MANKSCAEAAAGPVNSLHCVGASTAITAAAPAGRDADQDFCCPSTTNLSNPTYDGKSSGRNTALVA